MVTAGINIRGLKELERSFDNPTVVARPMRRFFLRGADYLQPRIERRIRKRTGRGRKSVERELDRSRKVPRYIKIFSKEFYIRIYEYGAPGHNQKARKPFRRELKRGKKVIFKFAAEAGREIAVMLAKGGR